MTDAKEPTTPSLEIAHVLFIDIVAYSTLHMDRQQQLLHELQEAVRNTPSFIRAQANDELIRLPTGDGMALVFFHDPEAPVRCAVELTKALSEHPIKLRMGIHTGPVYRIADINANRNVAGGGINIAQRVMNCGDAGHILVSSTYAEVLAQLSAWAPALHDLGEVQVKHSVRVHLYNLHTDDAGNPRLPGNIGIQPTAAIPALPKGKTKKRLKAVVFLIVAVLIVSSSVVGWLYYSRRASALSTTDTIVMGDVTNKTGDTIFDETVRRGVIIQLNQSPFVNLVSGVRVDEALRSLGRANDSLLTPELALEVCRKTISKAYLSGSLEVSSGGYSLTLGANSCQTGKTLAEEQAQAVGREDVLRAIGQVSIRVRAKLGEPASSMQRFDVTLDSAAPSLQSLHAYALGLSMAEGRGHYPKIEVRSPWQTEHKQLTEVYSKAAIPLLQEAIRWEPNFAMAYASLGECYWNLSWSVPATDNAKKAYELREQVGSRTRFAIETAYYTYIPSRTAENQYYLGAVPPRLEKARQVYEDWARTYPRDSEPHIGLGELYITIGQYEKSLREFREALRLQPQRTEVYFYIILLHVYLNQPLEAKAQIEEAAKNLSPAYKHWFLYQLAFLKNDVSGMAQEMAWASASGGPEAEFFFNFLEADTLAYYGKLRDSLKLFHRALESAKSNDWADRAWDVVNQEALLECLFGDAQECRRRAGLALEQGPSSSAIVPAFALAFGGEINRPEKFENKWEKEREPVPSLWRPLTRAQLSRNRKTPAKAVELLRSVAPHELTDEAGIYCIYVRGYANLDAPHLDDAEADFQEILDHRGLAFNSPAGALAHLGLARVRVQKGDTTGAKSAYQDFLTLWKDADADIPILKQAKAEYAKLQ